MAVCYLVYTIPDAMIRTTAWLGSGGGSLVTDYLSASHTLTIPNISGINSIKYHSYWHRAQGDVGYGSYSSGGYSVVIKDGVQIAQNSSLGNEVVVPGVGAGDTIVIEQQVSIAVTNGTPGTETVTCGYDGLYIIIEIDLDVIINRTMYAADINALATIFNTTKVTQGTSISRSAVQEIGTAVGNLKSTALGASDSVTAVTFDANMPLWTNIEACKNALTGRYSRVSISDIT